jgi:Fur family ferric uptake transcriptional regulator
MATPSLPELQNSLRQAGLRATSPRIAVLRVLMQAKSPVSHGEVADALVKQGLERATVYRNLTDLTTAGMVTRSDLGDHMWRFELASSSRHDLEHPHFICSCCGTVTCLSEKSVALKGALRRRNDVVVQLRGLCDACA